MWYYIEVVDDPTDDTQVKRIGPLNLGELRQVYQAGKLSDETYMWCDGMGEDFKQLKDLSDLRTALMTGDMASGGGGDGTSRIVALSEKIDLQRASWYYKDKMGAKQGPTVFNTLKLIWDFGDDVDESTPVFTNCAMKSFQVRLVKCCRVSRHPRTTIN